MNEGDTTNGVSSSRQSLAPDERGSAESALPAQGEIEAAICRWISRFDQEYMGRGPRDIRAHLLGDLLVVRLQAALTAPEQQLVQSLPTEQGSTLLKQMRDQLVETARPILDELIRNVTGIGVLSLHHDVNTMTGEEVFLFTLAESPVYGGRRANCLRHKKCGPTDEKTRGAFKVP